MAINGSDGFRGDVVVMMAVMTLVMQSDQEHWPIGREMVHILVSEIRGLSKPYDVKLIGYL